MHPPDPSYESSAIALDDDRWQRVFDLSNGSASSCFQCGTCTAACPLGLLGQDGLSVRNLIRTFQLGLEDVDHALWLCTTCGQCEAYCPRGVPISELLRSLRAILWETRQTPEGLPAVLWSVYWNNNPWFQPPSQREQWTSGLNVPRFDPQQHEILLYIGCTAAYDRRAQRIARALVRLLQAASVSFGTLGVDEPCCGESVLSLGHREYFDDIATQADAVFASNGVSRMVTVSPHCYDVFLRHYPQSEPEMEGLQVYHYTQFLSELVSFARLEFGKSLNRRLTYHDPCYLARHNDETKAPRRVLSALNATETSEMSHNSDRTLCCGGGGGHMWLETDGHQHFADLRITEALSTGADTVVTACPFCIACLEDSVKRSRVTGLEVLDLAEVVELALVKEC